MSATPERARPERARPERATPEAPAVRPEAGGARRGGALASGGRGDGAGAAPRGRRPGVLVVLAWELRKLRAQKRTWAALAAAAGIPGLIVLGTVLEDEGGGSGIPFGAGLGQTGLAVPLVGLFFGSAFLLPLLATLVSGDAVAAEDRHGTLKTILTRSVDRERIFLAKVLASALWALATLVVYVLSGLLIGSLAWGLDPLPSISGAALEPGTALWRLVLATGVVAMPLLAVAAFGLMLSALTRSSAASVVGALLLVLVMQLLQLVPALDPIQPYLLPRQLDAWLGVLRDPIDAEPAVRAAWVSAAYALPALLLGGWAFARRDVTGG